MMGFSLIGFPLCISVSHTSSPLSNSDWWTNDCFNYLNLSQVASLRVARPSPLLIKLAHSVHLTFAHWLEYTSIYDEASIPWAAICPSSAGGPHADSLARMSVGATPICQRTGRVGWYGTRPAILPPGPTRRGQADSHCRGPTPCGAQGRTSAPSHACAAAR